MSDIRLVTGTSSPTRVTSDGAFLSVQGTRDGAVFSANWFLAKALEGRAFGANSGVGSTPVTHAGAYDADGPDFHLHVPSTAVVIPTYIMVKYEAIGTESEMEVIGLASATGDSSVTGTALTVYNLRMDAPQATLCTATGAVDGAGVTDPNAGNRIEFWRRGHNLADTTGSGENDRPERVYEWKAGETATPPIVVGGGAIAVYATGQAATGFITVEWVELPANDLD